MPSSPYADLLLRCCQGELFALAPEGEENLLGMARNTEVAVPLEGREYGKRVRFVKILGFCAIDCKTSAQREKRRRVERTMHVRTGTVRSREALGQSDPGAERQAMAIPCWTASVQQVIAPFAATVLVWEADAIKAKLSNDKASGLTLRS
ncbi:uncharacterized protein MYCGRDRAFT_95625 [Zymoseptoria tritici IPO323]|uniref:Uncharacterized protein n=1 Tax=Zymoseptoria tritici (strain CBS 115943 / IPO323) TaxID=336722 RepID=F9XJG0_ZYMTI|nr:uncharacterized protein MYCGRDRAFT_95625 [Zymoseptoria tritici IPO323]EGP84315.1 hypothetical protein MYCGRDRAFT_95625 [Zymoseptoria tritici IPO323]